MDNNLSLTSYSHNLPKNLYADITGFVEGDVLPRALLYHAIKKYLSYKGFELCTCITVTQKGLCDVSEVSDNLEKHLGGFDGCDEYEAVEKAVLYLYETNQLHSPAKS